VAICVCRITQFVEPAEFAVRIKTANRGPAIRAGAAAGHGTELFAHGIAPPLLPTEQR
jgi:hypothetical protein